MSYYDTLKEVPNAPVFAYASKVLQCGRIGTIFDYLFQLYLGPIMWQSVCLHRGYRRGYLL